MSRTLRKSLCIIQSFRTCKSGVNIQNHIFSANSFHEFKPLPLSRGLTTGSGHSDEDRESAIAAFKVWTQSGLGNKGCVDGYSSSGKDYEEHMTALDFSGPNKMAEVAASILKDFKDARILDAAAGSGLGGVALQYLGYKNLDAVDASDELLQLAKAKHVYCNIMCHFLGTEPMPVDDGTYDMVVLSGAVGENHLPANAFDDLIRVVKPGGHVVNVYREAASRVPWYGDCGLEGYFAGLEKAGSWKKQDRILFPDFLTDMEGVALIHRII